MTTSPFDRYSLLYAVRQAPSQESVKARRRCGAEFRRICDNSSAGQPGSVGERLDVELGAKLIRPTYAYTIAVYWEKCDVEEFLDSLTLVWRDIKERGYHTYADNWIAFVDRVFREEHLSYRMDKDGVVRRRVDEEYEANVATLIEALGEPKYKAVRDAFERARKDLAATSSDTLDALRSLFEAAESLFRIVTGSGASLDEREVKKTLVPFVDRQMSGSDSVAKSSAARFVIGFADWVDACHPYRHGHDQATAPVPPIELAVALVSSGAAYIRWLATLARPER